METQVQLQGFRLSPQQSRVWSLQKDSHAYRSFCAVQMEGHLHVEVLREALQKVVGRHEILRTSFQRISTMPAPLQVISEDGDYFWNSIPLADLSPQAQEEQIRNILREERQHPSDLEQTPLLRALLLELSTRRHLLIISMPAITADARTLLNLVDELTRSYATSLQGDEPSDDSDELIQYLQFSEWQLELLEDEEAIEGRAYWERQDYSNISTPILPLQLRTVSPSPSDPPRLLHRIIDPQLCSRIESTAATHGVPLPTLLLACWHILLWRLSAETRLVVHTLYDGRSYEGLGEALGLFARYLPVPVEIEGRESFGGFIRRVHEEVEERGKWQEYFTWTPPPAASSASTSPTKTSTTTGIGFEYETLPAPLSHGGLLWRVTELSALVERFPLKLSCLSGTDGLRLEIHYDERLHAAGQMQRLAAQYEQLLKSACESAAEATLDTLSTVSEEERRLQLEQWNNTAHPYERACLHHLIEAQVERTPDATALVFEAQRLSYAELNRRANQLARHLREMGVKAEVAVGLMTQRSIEMLVALLGVLKAGGAYVPLDPSYPRERLDFMLHDAGVNVLLTQESLRANVPVGVPETLRVVALDAEHEQLSGYSGENLSESEVSVTPDNLAYLIYTSGSTGQPKGVLVSHRSVSNYLAWAVEAYALCAPALLPAVDDTPTSGAPLHSSLSFDLSVTALFAPLVCGHSVHLVSEDVGVEALAASLSRAPAYALVKLTPSHLELLSQRLPSGAASSAARSLVIGGEALTWEALRYWRESAPQTRLFNEYGPTEATVGCTIYEVRRDETGDVGGTPGDAMPQGDVTPHVEVRRGGESPQGGVPIGRPIRNTQVYVLDERMELVPVGVRGELYVGGECLARGYQGRAEQTAERFVPHPFSRRVGGGERLYRTGDVVRYLGDGNMEYVGRNDGQVKVRGYRVELGEIEAVLRGAEGVREAAVTLREGMPGDVRLVAYVVMRRRDRAEGGGEGAGEEAGGKGGVQGGGEKQQEGQSGEVAEGEDEGRLSEEEEAGIRGYVSERLPEAMRPWGYVGMVRMPLTANGKVDRKALPAPMVGRRRIEEAYVEARTEEEEMLAAIWAEVLGVERVGVFDNFFSLGGDSIRSVRAVALAKKRGLGFEVYDIFQHQTVAKLAREIKFLEASSEAVTRTQPFSLISESDRRKLPADVEDAYPLTVLQMGMLYHMETTPGQPIYHNVNSFRLRLRFDIEAFQEAVQQTVMRHANLRTSFDLTNYGEPLQLVHRNAFLPVQVIDLRHRSPAEQSAEADAFLEAENVRVLDLSRPPLVRFHFHRFTDETCMFTLTEPHAISDGWSTMSMVAEIFERYFAILHKEPVPSLEPPSLAYRDFVFLERMALDSEEHRQYWDEKLRDPNFVKLPKWPSRQRAKDAPKKDKMTVVVPHELVESLRQFAQSALVPFKSVLLAVHMKALSLISGQADIITGLGQNGRIEDVDGDQVRGLFLNTVPFRLRLPQGAWVDLVQAVFANERELLPYRRYPMAAMQKKWGRQPLFETMFSFLNFHVAGNLVRPGELELIPGMRDLSHTNFALEVNCELHPSEPPQLILSIGYDTAQFVEEQIKSFHGYYDKIMRAIASDPAARHESMSFLSIGERQQLLSDWNNAKAKYAADECLHRRFEAQAARTPDAVALVYEGQRLTYSELNARANQLARHLREMGVGAEATVGLLLERGVEMVVGLLAVLKAGGAYVPLDPSYPQERINFITRDAGVKVLLMQERLSASVPESASETLRVIVLDAEREHLSTYSAENLSATEVALSVDNLAYVIYTSGSTGQPKGVRVAHRNVMRLFAATEAWFGFDETDVWTLFHSYAFDFSVWEIWGALLYGGRLVVVPYLVSRDPQAFYELLRAEQVTVLNQTPSAFRQLIQLEETLDDAPPLGLRFVIFGGEALELQSLKPLFERHGDARPRLVNMYGITETTVHVTYRALSAADAEGASGSLIGRPIPDLQVYLLDPYMQLVPVGVAGEIYVGGEGLAVGYLNRADLTAERFLPNPFKGEPGARLYRSGDLARHLPDGDLEYLGRADEQVKVRGFRIELGEIESALGGHEGVREAVIMAREDEPGDKRLVAYVTAKNAGAAPTLDELRGYMLGRLPDYMIPAAFVVLDELPLTSNGKVDRRRLPAPEGVRPDMEQTYVAPRTPLEEQLASIWAEVLGVDRVGIDDNFFSLGGDSIKSIQVRAKAQHEGFDFSIQQLFKYQTISELAQAVGTSGLGHRPTPKTLPFELISDEDRSKLPDSVEDAYPVTELQMGMLYHSVFDPESALYHNVTSFHLRAPLDVSSLRVALERLVSRHPVLRTSFDLNTFSQPLQLVHRKIELPLGVEDLRGLTDDEQRKILEQRFDAEKNRPFTWKEAPLIRFHIYRRDEETFQFSFTEHHSILDGWSVATMLTELFQDYFNLTGGTDTHLVVPASVTYRDYVALERKAVASEEVRRYWDEKLNEATAITLPRVQSRQPEGGGRRGRTREVVIPPDVSEGLRRLAQGAGAPLKSVLLAAHLKVLSVLGGRTDVLTGLESNGRPEEPGAERVLGLFLNILPFRLNLSGGTWLDLVRQTFELEQEILPYRRYPLAEMQRRQGGQPLFETMFNFVHFHVYQNLSFLENAHLLETKNFAETNFTFEANFYLQNLESSLSQVHLTLSYDASELSDEQIEAIDGYYLRALTAMAQDPLSRYDLQSLIAPDERQRLLSQWNETAHPYQQACLHHLIEAQAELSPDATALIFEGERLTYAELNARANQLARHLREMGVGAEVRVGLMMGRSIEMVVGLLAVLKAGGAYVPLDPSYPQERLDFMSRDAGVRLLLAQEKLSTSVSENTSEAMRVVLVDVERERLSAYSDENLSDSETIVSVDNLAYIIYTSGSTGQPKGVLVSHRSVSNYLSWAVDAYALRTPLNAQVEPSSSMTAPLHSSLSFDLSVTALFAPLVSGYAVSLLPEDLGVEALASSLSQSPLYALVKLTPSHLELLGQSLSAGAATSAARSLVIGGEALSWETLRYWRESAPQTRLFNEYGPTEATVGCTVYQVKWDETADGEAAQRDGAQQQDGLTQREESPRGGVPIGRPIWNTEVYVLDERMQVVPVGVKGELYVGGECLARGYQGRAEQTAERFVPHPFSRKSGGGERLYRTGDVVRYGRDGELEYVGRNDGQVKVRGYRVELAEIEGVLREHESVNEVVVVAREGMPGDVRLVAYVVMRKAGEEWTGEREEAGVGEEHREGLTPEEEEEIRRYVSARLPEYMRPATYMWMERMPLTANGKVDRRALPAPTAGRRALEQEYVAPRTEEEEVLAAIWAEVLGVERVGVFDNFFQLGGHSLLATQVVSRVREVFQLEMRIRSLFEMTTVASLAATIVELQKEQQGGQIPRISRIEPTDDEQLAARLDELSDEEVNAMLNNLSLEAESE